MRSDYPNIIGCWVRGKIDRPLGSRHPRHPELLYPLNYGFVEGIFAEDKAEQDVYLLDVEGPVSEFEGRVIAVYRRFDDAEDKWIVSASGEDYSDEEILGRIAFQEQYFRGRLLR